MPFTPTHIVAVVPFTRLFRKLPFSALAIGSMVPDLPLFLPISKYSQTHSLGGVFTTCLPMGIVLFLLFQTLLKIPLIALCPIQSQRRLSVFSRSIVQISIPFTLAIAAALILGAFTHLTWDAFTHQGRWGTQITPFLNAKLTVANWAIPGYKIFQYSSTLIGLPWLAFFATKTLLKTTPSSVAHIPQLSQTVKTGVLLSFSLIPSAIALIAFFSDAPFIQQLGQAIANSGAILIIAILTYSLLFKLHFRKAKG